MEPVTHMLTGACLARALGCNKRARYATLAMVIAAEIPDADYIYRAGGPLLYFQHHRGWSHSFLWLPFWALVTVGIVWLWHRWQTRSGRLISPHAAPLRWGYLAGISLIALLSHILLDCTNNYGVQPFAPWNHHWYQGEIVFIFEPVLFVMLLLALVVAPIFGLADREIGARRHRAGQQLAACALFGMVAFWGLRAHEHGKAMQIASQQETLGDAPIEHVAMSPMPINPYRWEAILETPSYYQTGVVDTRTGTMTISAQDIFWKGEVTPAVQAAKASWLGRIYLDWSRYPLVEDMGISHAPETAGLHRVRFRDIRFLYDALAFHGREHAPLQGDVFLDASNHVALLVLDGAVQKQE